MNRKPIGPIRSIFKVLVHVCLLTGWAQAKAKIDPVRFYCANGLNFDYLSEFHGDFIPAYKQRIEADPSYFSWTEGMMECKHGKDAILELENLFNHSADDVCFPSHIERILDYHKRFIKNYETKSDYSFITRNLFKTYVLQVYYRCKRELQPNLNMDLFANRIDQYDYDKITPWLNTDDQYLPQGIDTIGKPIDDYDDLLVPEFEPEVHSTVKLVHLSPHVKRAFDQLQSTCQERMRPIYETVVMPVIRIAQAGYAFKGLGLADVVKEAKKDDVAKRFYTATQICELFRDIELTPIVGAKLKDEENDEYWVGSADSSMSKLEAKRKEQAMMEKWPKHHNHNCMPSLNNLWIKMEPEFEAHLKAATKGKEKTVGEKISLFFDKLVLLVKKKGLNTVCLLNFGCESDVNKSQRARMMTMFSRAMEQNQPKLIEAIIAVLTTE